MRKIKQSVKQSVRQTKQDINKSADLALKTGVPGAIRTLDPLLRSYEFKFQENLRLLRLT